MENIFLIDGSAIVYRSYFAFIKNPLINTKGQNTSAIYGTINSFLKLVEKFDAHKIAVFFDRKEPTFRKERYKDYKANRPPMPEDLVNQLEPINIFKQAKIAVLSEPGYEADDLIATAAKRFSSDYKVVIVSGDKDFCQLVDDKVKLYDPFKDSFTDAEKVKEKYGISPDQFIDYLALVGDSADNIPGVDRIGPKTAQKLLTEYRSLENIYKEVSNISTRIQKLLSANEENAFLSKELATMVESAPLELTEKALTFDKANLAQNENLLRDFELRTMLKKIMEYSPSKQQSEIVFEEEPDNKIDFNSILITSMNDFDELIKEISKYNEIAIDTETTSTDPLRAKLVGISICFDKEKAYYMAFSHHLSDNLDWDICNPILEKALRGKNLIGHNFKYDYLVLKKNGLVLENKVFDTMIASYVLNPGEMRHKLDKLSLIELGYEMKPISDLIGSGKKQITFDMVD